MSTSVKYKIQFDQIASYFKLTLILDRPTRSILSCILKFKDGTCCSTTEKIYIGRNNLTNQIRVKSCQFFYSGFCL